jgi:hypothetical protein
MVSLAISMVEPGASIINLAASIVALAAQFFLKGGHLPCTDDDKKCALAAK